MKKLILSLAVLAMAAFAFADPYVWDTESFLAEPALAQYGGSVTIATLSGSRTWNPHVSREGDPARDLAIAYIGPLTRNQQTLVYEPWAAESVDVSEDGLNITVTFRPDLQWSDGTPLTARDFFLTYTLATDPEVESSYADSFIIGNEPVKVELINDATLRYTFAAPNRSALNTVAATFATPDHILGEIYRNEGPEAFKAAWGTDTPVSELVFDGPFMLTSYSPDERYTLGRNPGFAAWNLDSQGNGVPYLDQINVVVAATDAQLNLFVAGELDVYSPINLDAVGVVNNAITNEGLEAVLLPNLYPTTSTTFYAFNWNLASDPFKQELFRNVFFRRAMSHLTPRDAIVDLVLGGAGEPAYSPITSALTQWYVPPEEQVRYEFDPEAAAELLAQIGFTERNAGGFLVDANGNELGFKLVTNAGNANNEQSIQLIADTMRENGVNVTTEALDFTLLVDQLLAEGDDRPFEAIQILLSVGDLNWPFGEALYSCTNGFVHMWNQSGACLDPRETLIQELQKQGIETLDDAAAQAISAQLQNEYAQMQPLVYTVVGLLHAAWTSDVGGEYNADTRSSIAGSRSLVLTFKK